MTLVVAVVGPTATGKSDLALALAEALDGEVVNADAMQLYRGMDIGVDHLATQALRERQAEVRLAGRGGPDDRDDQRHSAVGRAGSWNATGALGVSGTNRLVISRKKPRDEPMLVDSCRSSCSSVTPWSHAIVSSE